MLDKVNTLKKGNQIIGFTAGAFDLLHAGHCAMLAEAKANCNFLIVGIQTDPTIDRKEKNKPVQSIFERWVQLTQNKSVDLVIPYETESDLIDLLLTLKPDIRFVGEDYINKDFTGKDLKDIKIIYNSRQHSFSSSDLRKRVTFS
jgi:glycerol-3-phosphate cytidylyltransferase